MISAQTNKLKIREIAGEASEAQEKNQKNHGKTKFSLGQGTVR